MNTQYPSFEISPALLATIKFRPDGYVDNWFSNMLPFDRPLVVDGITYFTVENFYQASKIEAYRRELRVEIASMSPHKSKTCFRREPDKFVVMNDWTTGRKLRTMRYALNWKFLEGTAWHEKLMQTQADPIVEFNNWGDTFWGWDIKKETGLNHLGKILMEMRDRFNASTLDSFMS